MKVVEVLKRLGCARAVVVCHKSQITVVLAAHSIANILSSEGEHADLVELSPIHHDTLERVLELRGVKWRGRIVQSFNEVSPEGPIVVHAVGMDPTTFYSELQRLRLRVRVVFSHAAKKLGLVLKAPVIRIVELPRELYRASMTLGGSATIRVMLDGVREVVSDKKLDFLAMARSILLDSMAEYGPITVKDATNILSATLNVRKEEARKILYDLLEFKMVKIKNGYVHL
uniref:Uncharacterized protein n=1 Tax=Fervidicoccus fontis TaxID=683846 RepID=A0A7J3ZJU0_9CREN